MAVKDILDESNAFPPSNDNSCRDYNGVRFYLPTMKAASEILRKLEVSHEVTVVSATVPHVVCTSTLRTLVARGLKVIIAGAGGRICREWLLLNNTACNCPVKTSTLNGLELLSIVQMPRGIPVATVAIGNSKNVGLLAIDAFNRGYKSWNESNNFKKIQPMK